MAWRSIAIITFAVSLMSFGCNKEKETTPSKFLPAATQMTSTEGTSVGVIDPVQSFEETWKAFLKRANENAKLAERRHDVPNFYWYGDAATYDIRKTDSVIAPFIAAVDGVKTIGTYQAGKMTEHRVKMQFGLSKGVWKLNALAAEPREYVGEQSEFEMKQAAAAAME